MLSMTFHCLQGEIRFLQHGMQSFHVPSSFFQGREYPTLQPCQTILSSLNALCSLMFLLSFFCLQHSCPRQSSSVWPRSSSCSTISFGKPSLGFHVLLCFRAPLPASAALYCMLVHVLVSLLEHTLLERRGSELFTSLLRAVQMAQGRLVECMND